MDKIIKIMKGWRIYRKRISATLACIVAFVTAYLLVLPAITLDQNRVVREEGIVLEETSDREEDTDGYPDENPEEDPNEDPEEGNEEDSEEDFEAVFEGSSFEDEGEGDFEDFGDFGDGELSVDKELGGVLEADIADKVGWRDAQHGAQLFVEG